MAARGNVKGSVLQSRIGFVRRHHGDECVARVLERLPEAERAVLEGLILPFAWYPFQTNEQLDWAIAQEMGRGESIFRELGAASADDNLTSASQLHYIREHNPHALLKQATGIYGVYYDTGLRTRLGHPGGAAHAREPVLLRGRLRDRGRLARAGHRDVRRAQRARHRAP